MSEQEEDEGKKIKKRGPFTLDRRDAQRDATLRTVKVRRGTGGNGKQREKQARGGNERKERRGR